MNLAQYISDTTGQAVSYDGVLEDIGQCEQLVCDYWVKVFGWRCPPIAAAKDLWTNSVVLQYFTQIPVGSEQPGDVAVWGASSLIDSPDYGHTDIVINPGFLGFDSNWGGVNNAQGQPVAHQVQHTYTDVLGFLRWKEGNMPITEDQLYELIRGIAQREPTQAEASNTDYLNDPGLAIDTFWRNGGSAVYYSTHNADGTPKASPAVNKASVEAYIQENLS